MLTLEVDIPTHQASLSPRVASGTVVTLCLLLCAAGFGLLVSIPNLPPCLPPRCVKLLDRGSIQRPLLDRESDLPN